MPESLPPKKLEVEETLQFLKREEVRTMAKDMARLREEEAKKERERIASLREVSRRDIKIKTEEPKKEAAAAPSPTPQPIPPSLMPHEKERKPVFLRARTRSEKILIRAIVIGILLFVLLNGTAFGYWYFTRKKVVEIIPTPQPTQPAVEEPMIIQPPAAPAPLLFFNAVQEKIIDLNATDNLITLLSDALKEEYPQGFTRIFIGNGGGAFLTTREFLTRVGVAAPESLLSLLEGDFMLFAYSSPARKRLGIITELTQTKGAQDILTGWETTLEQDTRPLWEIVGQKGSAYTSFFRQTVHQNSLVRFQTFSVIDFGIVYTLFGTKLVLTTSFESLTKAVDQIVQSRP